MNKIAIALVAFVALAGVVSANGGIEIDEFEGLEHHGHGHLGGGDEEWEGRHQGFGGHGHHGISGHGSHSSHGIGSHSGINRHHGLEHGVGLVGGHHHGGLIGNHHSGLKHHGGIGHGKHLLKKGVKSHHGIKSRRGGLRGGLRGAGLGGAGLGGAGLGGAAGAGALHSSGAVGHAKHEAGIGGAAGSHTHLGSGDIAEGHQGSVIGGEKHFGAGIHSHGSNEADGIHKHKVIDSDQTIIKNRVKGVDDTDGFHHSSEHGEGAHIGAGDSGFASQHSGGKLGHRKDFEHDNAISAGAAHRTELDGAIGQNTAIGAGAAGGAALGGAGLGGAHL